MPAPMPTALPALLPDSLEHGPFFLDPRRPAVVLAPMEGVTDAPMRALQGSIGAFSYAVAEFLRVSSEPLPLKVFLRDIPELRHSSFTPTGLPVQVQLLGGDPERMALSAQVAVRAGARGVDLNFGCPAPIVNRHDGGASLLRHPARIRAIVAAVRAAVPPELPVSAKLRLGWDSIDAIHENAAMAAEGGASWLTIHARTREQCYQPPVFWEPIGQVRRALPLPIIANGDIWTLEDFRRCQDITGSQHYMLGRSALANPRLSHQIAAELGIPTEDTAPEEPDPVTDWPALLEQLTAFTAHYLPADQSRPVPALLLKRFKQWLNLAGKHGGFPDWDRAKRSQTVEALFTCLRDGEA